MAKPPQSQRRLVLKTSQAIFEKGALRQVIAEVYDGFLVLHLGGQEASYPVPWGAVYHLAAAQAAERELKARKAELGI